MQERLITTDDIRELYIPPPDSHKGQNGKLLIIGGSNLFHAASLWALETASRIVDLVHYSSVPENNALVASIKHAFRTGIVVPRDHLEEYIIEDDCILIGPGQMRSSHQVAPVNLASLAELNDIRDEGVQTGALTDYLLRKYPTKQWVIDAGSLQMLSLESIPQHAILTPHHREFLSLWENHRSIRSINAHLPELPDPSRITADHVATLAAHYRCIIVLKGREDIVCDGRDERCIRIPGGNAGMTKGGTGDVLSGLIAALACKNDPMRAALAGCYIMKRTAERLFETKGYYYHASDVANKIPEVMRELVVDR